MDLLDALKQKIASGTKIEQFSEILFFAHDALLGTIGRMAEDREIDDEELDQLIEFFQAFTAACEYEKECRAAALEAAGGADSKGDTNRATKISAKGRPEVEAINVDDVKPGWIQKKVQHEKRYQNY